MSSLLLFCALHFFIYPRVELWGHRGSLYFSGADERFPSAAARAGVLLSVSPARGISVLLGHRHPPGLWVYSSVATVPGRRASWPFGCLPWKCLLILFVHLLGACEGSLSRTPRPWQVCQSLLPCQRSPFRFPANTLFCRSFSLVRFSFPVSLLLLRPWRPHREPSARSGGRKTHRPRLPRVYAFSSYVRSLIHFGGQL